MFFGGFIFLGCCLSKSLHAFNQNAHIRKHRPIEKHHAPESALIEREVREENMLIFCGSAGNLDARIKCAMRARIIIGSAGANVMCVYSEVFSLGRCRDFNDVGLGIAATFRGI